MKRKLILPALLLPMVLALAVGLRFITEDGLQDVEFRTLKGERIQLRELRGHPVLVTFWASDCRPCIEEMRDLAELHENYAERGFNLISVAMAYDPPNRVLALTEKKRLAYPVALDPLGRIAEAFGGVNAVPNSFLIGPDGRIEERIIGRIRAEELGARIERMLKGA